MHGNIITEAFRTFSFHGLIGLDVGLYAGAIYADSDPRGKATVFNASFAAFNS